MLLGSVSEHMVIPIKRAMIRSGCLREREEVIKRGAFRKGTPRSAHAWHTTTHAERRAAVGASAPASG